ncbi:hypothetical protein MKY29_11260 [Psychrobacillus sp. FSL K6-2365]|uniref:hypothetical protein n=1 Tax=Psychrobacillus sp. FSL K6-2365 TaxID=2921546 RepID=UPI0030F58DD2
MLVSIAVVTLKWGLASEVFVRLYGGHFITNFDLSEDESIYWFGALIHDAQKQSFIKIGENRPYIFTAG